MLTAKLASPCLWLAHILTVRGRALQDLQAGTEQLFRASAPRAKKHGGGTEAGTQQLPTWRTEEQVVLGPVADFILSQWKEQQTL